MWGNSRAQPRIWDFFLFWVCLLALEALWRLAAGVLCCWVLCSNLLAPAGAFEALYLGDLNLQGDIYYEQRQNCHLPSRWDVPYPGMKGMELPGGRSLALWWEQIPLLNNSKGQEILWLTWDQENSGLSASFMLCRMNGSLPFILQLPWQSKIASAQGSRAEVELNAL